MKRWPTCRLVRHHAVMGMDQQPADEDRIGHDRLSDRRHDAHRLHGLGNIMGADDRGAVLDRQDVGGDRSAEAALSGGAGVTALMKRLRDAPTSSGKPNFLNRSSRAIAVMLCSGVLPKPMPGSSMMASRRMPARAAMASDRSKKPSMSARMSMLRVGRVPVMHDDDRNADNGPPRPPWRDRVAVPTRR